MKIPSRLKPALPFLIGSMVCPTLVIGVFAYLLVLNAFFLHTPLFGDPRKEVKVRNLTDTAVKFALSYDADVRAQLGRDETFEGNLDYANLRAEARDATGQVLFCQMYTYKELDQRSWAIEIVPNGLKCPAE